MLACAFGAQLIGTHLAEQYFWCHIIGKHGCCNQEDSNHRSKSADNFKLAAVDFDKLSEQKVFAKGTLISRAAF